MSKTMKVKVEVSKTYYKKNELEIELPAHLKFSEVKDYLFDNYNLKLGDSLSDATLMSDDTIKIKIKEVS